MTLQRCKQVKITITLNQLEGAILTSKINALNRWKAGECLCKAAFSAAFPEEVFKELKTFHFSVVHTLFICTFYPLICIFCHCSDINQTTMSVNWFCVRFCVYSQTVAFRNSHTEKALKWWRCLINRGFSLLGWRLMSDSLQQDHSVVYPHLMDVFHVGRTQKTGLQQTLLSICSWLEAGTFKTNTMCSSLVGGLLWLNDFYVIHPVIKPNTC